jgi:hypothetical protein
MGEKQMRMRNLMGEPVLWQRLVFIAVLSTLIGGFGFLMAQKPVLVMGNPSVTSGQLAVTATAQALASSAVIKNVCVKALQANAITVYVGGSGVTDSTGLELTAGQAVCLPVNNIDDLYAIASATGASVSWIATN